MATDFLLMANPFMFPVLTNFWTCRQIICTDSKLWLLGCTEWIVWYSKHVKCKFWYYNVAITSSNKNGGSFFVHEIPVDLHTPTVLKFAIWAVNYILIHCTQGIQNLLCWQCNSNIQFIWCSASHFSFNSFSKARKECAASSKKNVGIKVWLCSWRAYWYAVAYSFWNSHLWYAQIWRMEKDLRHCKAFIVQAQNLLLHKQNECIPFNHCVNLINIRRYEKTFKYFPSNMLMYADYAIHSVCYYLCWLVYTQCL